MAIKIKRSTGNLAPASLAAGQLAYSEGSSNGGTLYYGEIGGTVREIGGKKFVDKLTGIEAGAQVNTVTSVAGRTGAVTIAVADVSGAEATANKGQANGYASLDSSGLVPSSQLPSYVDDVIEGANLAAFPATGASGKIYVAVDTGKTYRWSGSTYVEISASPGSTDSVTEGSTNLYFTNTRARAAISVTDTGGDGSLSYNNSTGVLTFTGPSASDVRAHFSAGTGITITDGAIATTITQYTDSAARAAISVTQNLTYNSSTGVITGPNLSGYLTSESDPVFTASPAGGITSTQVGNWDDAYGWGDHGAAGYISAVEDDTSPVLGGNLDVDGNSITTTETNGNITLTPNGTGRVVVSSGVLQAGNVSVATNSSTASMLAVSQAHSTAAANAIVANRARNTLTSPSAVQTNDELFELTATGHDGTSYVSAFEITTSAIDTPTTGFVPSKTQFKVRTASGTVSTVMEVASDASGAVAVNGLMNLGAAALTIEGESGVDISAPGSDVVIQGLTYPDADGTANQVLVTDGDGVLSWATQSSGVTTFVALTDTPSSFTGSGGYYVKVNSGATALEFSQDVDDGTF
jgi:hypothetical protein